MLMEYTTKVIMEGIVKRDPKIYRYLDSNFRWRTANYVLKHSGTKEDGEELYNDVVCKIYLNIEKGSYMPQEGKFQGYFMTVVRNSWYECLRARKKLLNTVEFDDAIEKLRPNTQPTTDTKFELLEAMLKHLNELKDAEQELMELYYYGNHSVESVAQQMGMSADYVKVKLKRTRDKLRKRIKEDPELSISF